LSLKLLDSGRQVQVYGKIPKTQSAMYYYDILMDKYSERFCPIEKMQSLESFDLVVDCLLGIGIIGQLSAEYASYIDKINTGKYIVSCDIPSGLNSDNGKKSPVSVIANRTIAVQSYKTGHFLADGKDVCGKLEICDIGIEIFGKKYFKNALMILGVVLWVGALSPEIFVNSGIGCILDENGEELTVEEAKEFMESYFYGDTKEEEESAVKVKYKFALLEFWK